MWLTFFGDTSVADDVSFVGDQDDGEVFSDVRRGLSCFGFGFSFFVLGGGVMALAMVRRGQVVKKVDSTVERLTVNHCGLVYHGVLPLWSTAVVCSALLL